MDIREIIAREICRQSATSLYSRWSSIAEDNQTWFRRADQILKLMNGTSYLPSNEGITCPYCSEQDFDKVGLKYHLNYHCKQFQEQKMH